MLFEKEKGVRLCEKGSFMRDEGNFNSEESIRLREEGRVRECEGKKEGVFRVKRYSTDEAIQEAEGL